MTPNRPDMSPNRREWIDRDEGLNTGLFLAPTHWWAFVLRGVLAVVFGIATFIIPSMALRTLIFLFGVYAISDAACSTSLPRFARKKAQAAEAPVCGSSSSKAS